MNQSIESHEPTPEFLAHMEWQIETALRRESRLSMPVGGGRPRFRAALIVVVAVAIGAVAGVASGRVQDARQRDALSESMQAQEALARARVELAQTAFQETRRRFEVGTVDRESLMAAERDLRAMETALARIHLDLEEIRLTSAPPRNDLDSPLVGTRDFVRERLALDLTAAQSALVMAEQALSQAQQRVDVGTAPLTVVLQAQADLVQARTRMQLLEASVALRRRYLKGDIKREALAPAYRRAELTLQIERAQRDIEITRRRVDELRTMVAVGQAMELDLKRAEVNLLERQVEIERIQRELAMIGSVKR